MRILLGFCITCLVVACKKDTNPVQQYTPRDYNEVLVEDETKIQQYLKTHFYNYEDFQKPLQDFDYKIVLDTIAGSNASKTPLIDQVKTLEVAVSGVAHKLYYVIAKDGAGKKPFVADSVFVSYKGQTLNGKRFDFAETPIWMDLSTTIRGFSRVLSQLSSGTSQKIGRNPNGTYKLPTDGGTMFMIMPSGLAYFDGTAGGKIASYSPVIYTLSSYLMEVADQDADGIISLNEDLNRNGDPEDDDTDGDRIPNYKDLDDDNDGIPTKDEYDTPYDPLSPDDRDRDGIPDYLDKD